MTDPEPIDDANAVAEVVLCMGRYHLKVAGFYLATEGDKCRDGNLPEAVFNPIPAEELAQATIGGIPASEIPVDVVRFFRGDVWNRRMMDHVAGEINRAAVLRERPFP